MTNCKDIYQQKCVSMPQALEFIHSGDIIGVAAAALEPVAFLNQLHTIAPRIDDITVLFSLSYNDYPFVSDPSYQKKFRNIYAFFGKAARAAHERHQASFSPAHMHHGMFRRRRAYPVNVFVGTATPMDEHGYMRLSLSLQYEKELVEMADRVILEVNPNLPVVGGDTEVHIRDVDAVVEVDRPIPTAKPALLTEADIEIGRNVASLIPDGATIQLGIGSIPDAIGHALMDKHDLGVHTEMLTSCIADLVDAGVITNRKKTLHKGKIVCSFAYGDEHLYHMMHNNPAVLVMPSSYVNNPFIIAQNDNMYSINTTLAVDLTGQVASETIGSMQFSGSGGQNDTAEGAIHSKGGHSIIALRSTTKNHQSKITANLPLGSVVTLSRNNVDYIVTEYGIADLCGRSVQERVERLIEIAHPDFRAELRRDAQHYKLW